MTDTTEVERFEPYTDEGNREGYGQMEPCEGGDWVRATDYDALAAKLAEQIEWVKRLADDLIAAEGREAKLKAKLAELGAERDHWETFAIARQAKQHAAEARIAHLENHIEAVAKDTHKIMVAYEATPMRCAECDCEKGGADCNWIATPTPAMCCLGLTPEQCAHTPSSQCEGLRPAVDPMDDPRVTALVGLLKEARDDIEAYVDADWPENLRAQYPSYLSKWERDMELCRRIDAVLSALEENK